VPPPHPLAARLLSSFDSGLEGDIRGSERPGWYTSRVPSNDGTSSQPVANEIRVEERDGRRLLQQWKLKPDGYLGEYDWVDITELGPLPPLVRRFGADR
jgi:hypothetical protein